MRIRYRTWLRRQQVRAERWAKKRTRQPEPHLIHVARKVAWMFDNCPECQRGWKITDSRGLVRNAIRCPRCDGTGLTPGDKFRAYCLAGTDLVSIRWLAAYFFDRQP